MLKFKRGTSLEYTAYIIGIDKTSPSWKDNIVVNLVSTYIGAKHELCRAEIKTEQSLSMKTLDKMNKTRMFILRGFEIKCITIMIYIQNAPSKTVANP